MGRAPAYIFVVRHGNRLDAANKQWHLQSPTPYDPPLTYSGWNQARAVGQRIGEILRDGDKERDKEQQADSLATDGTPRKRRKYKVAIHSSPFLRCVQTSIGISAGLASIPEPPTPTVARASSTHSVTNPRLRPTVQPDVSVPPPTPPTSSRPSSRAKSAIQKTVLRLDAFLGEWLTPGYFELITPPPGSGLMLASAKAELLRKEDYSSYPGLYAHHAQHNSSSGAGAGQMWGQSPVVAAPENGLENVGSLAEAMRRAGRSDSVTSNGESHLITGGAYVAPMPTYALSHNAEIPRGYVPHARDNCCDIDYQWDSMRGPLDWGDGGSYGEEWTAMHHRFRKGLQNLVDWYATHERPADMVTKERRDSVTASDDAIDDEEEDVETDGGITVGSGVTSFLKQTPTSAAGGLWSPLRNTLDTPDEGDDDDFLPNFTSFDIVSPSTKAEDPGKSAAEPPSTPKTNGNGTGRTRADSRVSPRAIPVTESSQHEEEERHAVPALPQLGSGTGGLWGSPKPIGTTEIPRDLTSPKRRWTVTERWT
ncbi:hypothetical protein INS49_000812 [Diaporthe citri]|uniref:uncharacterized protein n=1 Tax=Diaporthe citri TaxID=83186 RepID=UPI001C7F2518|nr:uncharacterized protein INS49_000812 [Diaporthe citri]KAG6366634.1 hypothetical protein INS49_000812 [Diaporthe citri]